MSTLRIRDISPEIAGLIQEHKYEHGHKTLGQAVECITREWAELKGKKK